MGEGEQESAGSRGKGHGRTEPGARSEAETRPLDVTPFRSGKTFPILVGNVRGPFLAHAIVRRVRHRAEADHQRRRLPL